MKSSKRETPFLEARAFPLHFLGKRKHSSFSARVSSGARDHGRSCSTWPTPIAAPQLQPQPEPALLYMPQSSNLLTGKTNCKMATTGKLLLALVALSALAATGVANRPLPHPYTVEGKVYCDTCRCGFETSATVYIPRAKVRLECRGREDLRLMYSVNGETDSNGKFLIHVDEDHQEQICDVVLVSSPWGNCRTADPGRSSTRVIVTNNNGIRSYKRFANNMGFLRDHALPLCGELLKYYLQSDDE